MRLDLFSKGDAVLLLGEGNFSFSVCLLKHKLPISIVATCHESECKLQSQAENIEFLRSEKVPVYFNVDATKLHENANFSETQFSKIIFNFPHVGGKMKIHLNRKLLQKVFESCSKIIRKDGLVIISLCRGQGGTPADKPRRRWDDTWQVTEMAAHGDFVLTAVEPFVFQNFPEYRCVGYRGQDVKFNLNEALVHIFAKGQPLYSTSPSRNLLARRMNLVPIERNSNVSVPIIYSELYQNNPLKNSNSPVSFLRDLLMETLSRVSPIPEWRFLGDDDVPVHVAEGKGVPCHVDNETCVLRLSSADIFPHLLSFFRKIPKAEGAVFLGPFFKPLKMDFSIAPVEFRFIVAGKALIKAIQEFFNGLILVFKCGNLKISQKHFPKNVERNVYFEKPCLEFAYESVDTEERFLAGILYEVGSMGEQIDICVVDVQAIIQHFFQIGWKEIWARNTKVVVNEKPCFFPSSLHPSSYKFDVTLKYKRVYSENKFYELLWLAAWQVIEKVEMMSEYFSSDGKWSSKCYRITYKSVESALHRERVLEIHSKIIGRTLELGLEVTIA